MKLFLTIVPCFIMVQLCFDDGWAMRVLDPELEDKATTERLELPDGEGSEDASPVVLRAKFKNLTDKIHKAYTRILHVEANLTSLKDLLTHALLTHPVIGETEDYIKKSKLNPQSYERLKMSQCELIFKTTKNLTIERIFHNIQHSMRNSVDEFKKIILFYKDVVNDLNTELEASVPDSEPCKNVNYVGCKIFGNLKACTEDAYRKLDGFEMFLQPGVLERSIDHVYLDNGIYTSLKKQVRDPTLKCLAGSKIRTL